MMDKQEIIKQYEKFVIPTYNRFNLVVNKGKGSKVWDIDGKEYLDFFPGWAVSGIGHCHETVVQTLKTQLEKVLHVSNNYYNEYQGKLAQMLIQISFPGKVFFCNSGAESIESAIKLARRFGNKDKRCKIVVMENSFHGRTFGALTATGQNKYKKGFGPLLEGFVAVPFNNIDALDKEVDAQTVAVLIEPIQGEGGINIADKKYLTQARELCYDREVLLILDEIQTGMGRTGEMFCYQHYDIVPDVITLAKSLGGGIPIGAMIAGEVYQNILGPGTHASTFGGSPVACVAAIATINAIQQENLLANVETMGDYLKERLIEFKHEFEFIKQVRGKGLMLGMELSILADAIVSRCLEERLLINCTQENILRFLPAMNITKHEIDQGLEILYKVLKGVTSNQ